MREGELAVNKDMTDVAAKDSARRRLVRGVFAAPAALTLYNGSVAAASLNAVARQLANPITTEPLNSSTLVRVPLFGLKDGNNSATFVRQAEIDSLLAPGGSYLSRGQAQCVSTSGNGLGFKVGGVYDNPMYKKDDKSTAAAPEMTKPRTEYAVVRFNKDLKIEGVLNIPSGGGSTALAASAAMSMGIAAPFQAR
jgi:hypothetical protein